MADENGLETKPAFVADGVHLLRTTQQVQYQLSQMADQKASMLLGITFVIFTISIGRAATGAPHLPILILGGAAFVAAFLAVLAVLPAVTGKPSTGGEENLLFFGSFTRMPEAEFVDRLLQTVTDNQAIYRAFARDIYQNGRVLQRKKYRLLGWSYRVLLAGLVLSLLSYVGQVVLAGL